jgi:hypothetical protein
VRALALILGVLAACDAGAKPPPPEAVKPVAKSPQPEMAVGGFALQYMPADADLLVQLDVAVLRSQSKLWAKYGSVIAKPLRELQPGCAYDPLQDITTITMGLWPETNRGVYVVRGIDRDKTLTCVRGRRADSLALDGDFVIHTDTSGTGVMKFVDAHTLVVQTAREATKDTLTALLQQSGYPLGGKDAMGPVIDVAYRQAISGAALTVLSRPGSKFITAKMAQLGFKPTYFYASARLTDRLDVRFAMVLATSAEATQLTNMVKGQTSSPQVKQLFDRFDVAAQRETVTVDVGMTEAQLTSMAGLIASVMQTRSP